MKPMLLKGKRYFYPHAGKQVTFLRWNQIEYAVVVDDKGEQYHVPEDELDELPPQVAVEIGEDVT